ncbi:hypothetical protein QYE73_22835 [Pseudomonas mosselii]|uniref:hypothetical protein n=1 Tax=Pseudomonas mosselii TaxID=78327 RepID=UPI002618CC47|nr:hypothetical protein [Pseudomonas mosselii]MDN4500128.1 hypothetical protein [Pseudomonas mosselii]
MKALSMQSVTVALLAVAVTGIGYNTMMNHRHQVAYAIGMDMLAALEAEPTTYTTFVEDGVTWHQKCEKGHCIMATNRDDLAGPIVRKGAPGGFPTTDMSAIRALEIAVSSFETWAASVKRQMVELGMSSSEAAFAVEENEQWFADQFEAGAGTGITADEWFNHHHDAE